MIRRLILLCPLLLAACSSPPSTPTASAPAPMPADTGMPTATDPVVEIEETEVADPGIDGAVDESAPGDPAAP